MAAPGTPGSPNLQALYRAIGQHPHLDPKALLAVFSTEGLNGGIGDGGHAFGPAQLNNAGGAYPAWAPQDPQQANQWAWSPQGLNYALSGIAKVARGQVGPQAVNTIVSQFERPADQQGEIQKALSRYGTVPGLSQQPATGQPGVVPGLAPQPAQAGGKIPGLIEAAQGAIGTPYSWGGGGPGGASYGIDQGANIKGFDCSGLVQYAYAKVGVNIGGDTYSQWAQGTPVARNDLQRGDAVFFEPTSKGPGHVAIYIGDGHVIAAPHTGVDVQVQSLDELSKQDGYVGARRYLPSGLPATSAAMTAAGEVGKPALTAPTRSAPPAGKPQIAAPLKLAMQLLGGGGPMAGLGLGLGKL